MDAKGQPPEKISNGQQESEQKNQEPVDIVDEASRQSFPASDSPAWNMGRKKEKTKKRSA